MKTTCELGTHLSRAYIDRKPFEVMLNIESNEDFNHVQRKPVNVPSQLIDAAMRKTKHYALVYVNTVTKHNLIN